MTTEQTPLQLSPLGSHEELCILLLSIAGALTLSIVGVCSGVGVWWMLHWGG